MLIKHESVLLCVCAEYSLSLDKVQLFGICISLIILIVSLSLLTRTLVQKYADMHRGHLCNCSFVFSCECIWSSDCRHNLILEPTMHSHAKDVQEAVGCDYSSAAVERMEFGNFIKFAACTQQICSSCSYLSVQPTHPIVSVFITTLSTFDLNIYRHNNCHLLPVTQYRKVHVRVCTSLAGSSMATTSALYPFNSSLTYDNSKQCKVIGI